jgi:glycerophosphoryl diester phosphodiesterase
LWQNVKTGIKRLLMYRRKWLREKVELVDGGAMERMLLHPCVAHRGWSGRAPENTLAAFRLAMQLPAVQWLELDVQLSRDGIPVVIHDPTLKRTTNGGKRRVSTLTAAELAGLDAGAWYHPDFAGQPVPTLDQVLALTVGRCKLNVEIKGEDADPGVIVRQVLNTLKAHGMTHDAVITSFRPEVLKAVKQLDATVRTGLILDANPPDLLATVQSLGCSMLSIGYRNLTAKLLDDAAQRGILVMAWTVNGTADLKRLVLRPEPVMICTNHPDRWLAAIENVED